MMAIKREKTMSEIIRDFVSAFILTDGKMKTVEDINNKEEIDWDNIENDPEFNKGAYR
jgi:hypothetical protein